MSETKRTVAVLYALALSTCFLPLFNFSAPALGKSEWSALDIFRLLASGPKPPVDWRIQNLLFGIWLCASGRRSTASPVVAICQGDLLVDHRRSLHDPASSDDE